MFDFAMLNATEAKNLQIEESEINKTIKGELDELLRFIEGELKVQSFLAAAAQDSTQFSSCSEGESEENQNENLRNEATDDADSFGEKGSEALRAEEEYDKAGDDNFISAVTKEKKHPQQLNNLEIIKQNITMINHIFKLNECETDKFSFENINNYNDNIVKNENEYENNSKNQKNNTNNNNNSNFKAETTWLKTNKKFLSTNKNQEEQLNSQINALGEKANEAQKEQAKADFKNIFAKIEHKLRNYLKQSHHKKIFESKAFESFLNEEKLKTPLSGLATAKSQTPSIIKNFFEDKEVIEVTKKRHSVAGESLKNRLEKLKELEFNQKCFSNFRNPQSLLRLKDASLMDRKNSEISDFSVNLEDKSPISGFDALACDKDKKFSEFDVVKGDMNVNGSSVVAAHRISGLRLSKRGSILRERFSNFNNCAFDVVQEEERIVDLDESGSADGNDDE